MLIRLEISDFAVISHAVFEPSNGFNTITGETGAGKSLLIDAIGLILGQKASKNLIRTNSDSAFVEAVFDISDVKDQTVFDLLNDSGIEVEDNILIISRKVSRDGKSIARINGRTVVLAVLKAISSYLVDIHGQHDTQRIFDESCHSDMLDGFGGNDISDALDEYQTLLKEMKEIVLEIQRLSISPDDLQKRKDYLKYAVNEINSASLSEDEDDKLAEQSKKMKLMEKNASHLEEADDLINGEDGSSLTVSSRIHNAYKIIAKLASETTESSESSKYNALAERLLELSSEASEISSIISDYVLTDSYDRNRQEEINTRLGLIYDLKAKYSCKSLKEVIEFGFKAEDELNLLENNSKAISDLKKKRQAVEGKLLDAANKLSDVRQKYASKLSEQITSELKDLMMPDSRFEVQFVRRSKERFFGATGIDIITFVFSANPGQELRSLAQTASGGEASRIMLAIKNVLSMADLVPTLIFDEIDTGVSGSASTSIAKKLKSISKYHQVLCVTHTAQLAAASDYAHFISKEVEEGNTSTNITKLDEDSKINEISRLLSGTNGTSSISLAKDLIDSLRT